jgi:uncharacterized protein
MIPRYLAAALLSVATIAASAQTIQVSKQNRTIAITATERVLVMADIATIHIGFIAYGPDSAASVSTGSRISNAIVRALTSAGIPSDAIQSENQNVSPVQSFQQERWTAAERAQRQFQITQSWTVRVAADAAAKTLDLAVRAGANQSGQIDWSLRDENTPQAEAAAKALQQARAIAAQMATGMKVELGVLLFASNETQANPIRPMMQSMVSSMARADATPLAINPRQIEKSATVYAVFAIE